jgi:hypothetical protein
VCWTTRSPARWRLQTIMLNKFSMEMYLPLLKNFSTLLWKVLSFQKPSGVSGTSCIQLYYWSPPRNTTNNADVAAVNSGF